jgi:uncharacterized membrane protein YuzA (DUF378 family)
MFYIYIGISTLIALIVLKEMFTEKNWKTQLALSLVLIPLLLRIAMIK